jgi:hypothetical protein
MGEPLQLLGGDGVGPDQADVSLLSEERRFG